MTPARLRGGAQRDFARWLPWLVALIGVANLVVLFAQMRALSHRLYLNADHASALVLAALASHAPANSVIDLGDHPWYEPWWLMRATAGLPHSRQLWEAAPFVFGLLGIVVVAACAWWALGRLAGLMCGAVLIAASEPLRGTLYVPESHGLIVLHAGVLCGALLLVRRMAAAGRPSRRSLIAIGLPLAIFTGAGLTDQLLLVSGFASYLLAPPLCWLRLRSPVWREVSFFALATGAVAVLSAALLSHVMNERHVIHAPFPIDFVSSNALIVGLQNLVADFASLGGGAFFAAPVSGANLLTFSAGALALLALACVGRALRNWIASPRVPAANASQTDAGDLFTAYWGLALLFVLAAFALTGLSGSAANGRYLIGAWVAVAALLGVLVKGPATRVGIPVAVAAFGVLNLRAELATGVQAFGPGPDQRQAGAIEHFAAANGAGVGYGGYWDSAPVTWETDLRIRVYPIEQCSVSAGWCEHNNNQISSWYAPRARTRTFLVVDTRPGVPFEVTSAPSSFGHPIASEAIGEGLTVDVYNHDIAANLAG